MKQSQAVVRKRHENIIAMIEKQHNLSVTETSLVLQVSELTIRRDFDTLASKGLIVRYHGGAREVESAKNIQRFSSKNVMNKKQKELIAQIAVSFIKDGDSVTLNAGSTTRAVLRAIKDKKATVITNNATAFDLLDGAQATLICTGGQYNARNNSYTDALTNQIISAMYSNVCIIGANGITAAEGITTAYYPETSINQMFIAQNRGLKIIVADGSKIGHTYCYNSSPLSTFDILITDSSADPDEIRKIKETSDLLVILADTVNPSTLDVDAIRHRIEA